MIDGSACAPTMFDFGFWILDFGFAQSDNAGDRQSSRKIPDSRSEISNLSRSAFTLVELLVVIAIIGALIALLLPGVQAAREASRRTVCKNNLRQIGLALQNYHNANRRFPVGCLECTTPTPRRQIAWSVYVLPQLELQEIWQKFDFEHSYESAANRDATSAIISVYLCPSTYQQKNRPGLTTGDKNNNGAWDDGDYMGYIDYGGMFGSEGKPNGTMIYEIPIATFQIRDGLSQTILVAEDTGRGGAPANNGEWANGQNIFDQTGRINQSQNNEMWSDHRGGVNVVFCDGSVHFLSEYIDTKVLFALCTRDQAEVFSTSSY